PSHSLMSAMKALAPSARSRSAVARPMPCAPPVTTAVLPSNRFMASPPILDPRSMQRRQMRDLRADLVVGFLHMAEPCIAPRRDRQKHVLERHLTGDVPGDLAAENRAGRDATAVESDERDQISGGRVQPGQMVGGRADPTEPFVLEGDVAELREEGLETPSRPGAMDGMAGVAQRRGAVDDEATGRI